jgi:type I restriction enzyme S subunit
MELDVCGQIPRDWSVATIEDVCERVTSGGTPSRARPEYYCDGKWGWVKTQELLDGWIDTTEEQITDEAIQKSSAKILPANTVLLALYGATVGQLGIIRCPMTCNQACCAIIVDPRKADFRYVYHQLRLARPQLRSLATGAAQQNLSGALMKSLRLPLPPLPEQKRIAHILGTLDDKIELNRRMNATLEAMSRAIFKSWFVDFDPVRQKAAGKQPVGMDAKTAALFPDSFEDSEIGEVPKGWRVGSILEQASLLSGGTPKTDEQAYWGGSVPWASAKDVSQCGEVFLAATERTITQLGVDRSATKIIPANTTVVVSRGATTGRLAMFAHDMAMNQTCYGLHSRLNAPYSLYCNVRSFIDRMVSAAHGSVFDTITTSTFETTPVLLVPQRNLAVFEAVVADLFGQVRINIHQSRTLAALRDTLLPKLLSGELRIPKAEQTIEEATA